MAEKETLMLLSTQIEERRKTLLEAMGRGTDKFEAYTNFPFFLSDWDTNKNKTKMIKKGTPIALVFPFKRDDWQMNVVNDKDLKDKINVLSWKWFTTLVDTYKNKTWARKNYK